MVIWGVRRIIHIRFQTPHIRSGVRRYHIKFIMCSTFTFLSNVRLLPHTCYTSTSLFSVNPSIYYDLPQRKLFHPQIFALASPLLLYQRETLLGDTWSNILSIQGTDQTFHRISFFIALLEPECTTKYSEALYLYLMDFHRKYA